MMMLTRMHCIDLFAGMFAHRCPGLQFARREYSIKYGSHSINNSGNKESQSPLFLRTLLRQEKLRFTGHYIAFAGLEIKVTTTTTKLQKPAIFSAGAPLWLSSLL